MSEHLPYEQHLQQQWTDIPMPDQDAAWADMRSRLEDDNDDPVIIWWRRPGCVLTGLLLVLLLVLGWWMMNRSGDHADSNINKQTPRSVPDKHLKGNEKPEEPTDRTTRESSGRDEVVKKDANTGTDKKRTQQEKGNTGEGVSTKTTADKGKPTTDIKRDHTTGQPVSDRPVTVPGINRSSKETNTTQGSKFKATGKNKGDRMSSRQRPDRNTIRQTGTKYSQPSDAETDDHTTGTIKRGDGKKTPHSINKQNDGKDQPVKEEITGNSLTTTQQGHPEKTQQGKSDTMKQGEPDTTHQGKPDITSNNPSDGMDTATKHNDSLRPAPINKPSIKKKDTATTKTPTVAPADSSDPKRFYFSTGIAMNQLLPVAGQKANPYNAQGRKGSLADYIPSVYVRLHRKDKWFLQGEFRYGAPQYAKDVTYHQNIIPGDSGIAPRIYTTNSLSLKKTFYHQLPLTFNYYVLPNWSVGAGAVWNKFYAAVSDYESILRNRITQEEIVLAKGIASNKKDTTGAIAQSYFQAVAETQYQWKRLILGARYAFGLQPYVKFTLPGQAPREERNSSLQVFLRLELWRSEKKK